MWLNGDVLMCSCPDCRAPMTVRLWLMVADCWQCGTSIELTEEQEREAQRLLAESDASRSVAPAAVSDRARTRMSASTPADNLSIGSAQGIKPPSPAAPLDSPAPRRPATRHPPSRMPTPHRRRAKRRRSRSWLYELFDCTPAWLISLVFHLVMLTLLALFTLGEEPEEETITLSAVIGRQDEVGGDVAVVDPRDKVDFDLPIPKHFDMTDKKVREVVVKADQDARELRLDPGINDPNLAGLAQVKATIGGGSGPGGGRTLAARDPRIRSELVSQEGGTTMSEAAVARGLRWLALHQHEDGNWSLHRFDDAGRCGCGGKGSVHSDSAATSLALLPFLGAGQTHLVGRYKNQVSAGLRWLVKLQKPNGDLRGTGGGNAGMYAHGQGAIVLCEAYLMTGDEDLHDPAQRSIDFIVEAQHVGGGWRYEPGQAGDTSVLGWQLMALQSARAANLKVPEETMELAARYLDAAQDRNSGRYAYVPGHAPTPTMTAEALLCRIYLGAGHDEPTLRRGVNYLSTDHLPRGSDPNMYYWYYATQTMHHVGGHHWDEWNGHMREVLVEQQERRGHEAGSWAPRGPHADAGGRIYQTALAICCLEVYYRHLPIFRQITLE